MTQPLQHQPRQMWQTHQHGKPTAAHKPTRKLGRKPRSFSPSIPHYSALRRAMPHPKPPTTADWLTGMPEDLSMMCNNELGCCTIAALHHARQVWTFHTTGIVTDPDRDVLIDYQGMCGYVTGDASTDNGGNEQDVLTDAVRTGITTEHGPDKLLAFVELDPRQHDDIKTAISEGGLVYLGADITQAFTQVNPGDTLDVSDSPVEGGHAFIAAAYDAETLTIITWGFRVKLTWAAFDQMTDEAYLLADSCWLQKTGKTPGGLTMAQLEAAMQAVRAS